MFTEYSIWLLPLIVIAAGLMTFFAYYYKVKKNSFFTDKQRYLLSALRFLSLFFIMFLLLSPVKKVKNKTEEKPTIVICQDNSQSIKIENKNTNNQILKNYLKELDNVLEDLEKDYNIVKIAFSSSSKEFKTDTKMQDSIKFNGFATDISNCLNFVSENYSIENLSAVILATDGIATNGVNFLNLTDNFSCPIYTIAFGDTSTVRDLQIADIQYNNIVFKDNDYPVEITIKADKALGKKSALFMQKDGKTKEIKNFVINSDDYSLTTQIKLSSVKAGMEKISFYLSTVDGEKNKINNRKDIYVDVLNAKKKVLITAPAPHADISALKAVMQTHKGYDVDVQIMGQNQKNASNYDLIIAHNLPNNSFSFNNLKNLINKQIPILFIVGQGVNRQYFNALNTGIRINGINNGVNQALGVYNPSFSAFTLSPSSTDILKKLPPLLSLASKYELKSNIQVLLFQQISSTNSNAPLIAFNNEATTNFGFIFGENLWRWRLQDYLINEDFNAVDEILGKTIQLSANKTKKERFKVEHKDIYSQNEDITFSAQLYNENYEMINTPEVYLTIKGKNTNTYTFGRNNNAYYLNMGHLDEGEYSFEAKTKYDNKTLIKKGVFAVSATNLELSDTKAKHSDLFTLSQKTNAKMLYPQDVKQLKDLIKSNENIKPIIHVNIENKKFISLWWYWLIIILCLGSEWVLRKYFGKL